MRAIRVVRPPSLVAAMGRSYNEQAARIACGNGTDVPLAGSTHTITTLPSAYTQA